jgi:hypothetical protein
VLLCPPRPLLPLPQLGLEFPVFHAGPPVCVKCCNYCPVVELANDIILYLSGEAIMVHWEISDDDVPPAGHVLVVFFGVGQGKSQVPGQV